VPLTRAPRGRFPSVVRRKVFLDLSVERRRVPSTPAEIQRLEELHSITDAYLWLGMQFGGTMYVELDDAAQAASKLSDLIQAGLRKLKAVVPGSGSSGGGGSWDRKAPRRHSTSNPRGSGQRGSRSAVLS
jgi:hypothetical protein